MRTEIGSTMIDFLAGLALIGVATVGALVGYNWAVDTASARKIYDGVTTRAMVAQGSALVASADVGDVVRLGGFSQQVGGTTYTLRKEASVDSNLQFSIEISAVSNGICRRLLAQNYSIVPLTGISVNGRRQMGIDAPSAADCGNANSVTLIFYFDMVRNNVPGGCVGDACHPDEDDNDDECDEGQVWNPFDKTCVDVSAYPSVCGPCQDGYMCAVGRWAGASESSDLTTRPTCQPADSIYVQGQSGRVYLSSPTTMSWWDAMNFCQSVNLSSSLPVGILSEVADFEGAWTSTTIGHNAFYTTADSLGTDNKVRGHFPLCPTNDCTNNNPCQQVQANACVFSDKPDGTRCQTNEDEAGYCYGGQCSPICATDDDCVNPKVCGDLKVCVCADAGNVCKIITNENTCASINAEDGTVCHTHGQCESGVCRLDNCHYIDDLGLVQKADSGDCVFNDKSLGGLMTPGTCQNGVCGPISCDDNDDCPEDTYCRYQPENDSQPANGTCRAMGDTHYATSHYGIFQSVQTMDWWSAGNWCAVATSESDSGGSIVANSSLCGAVPSVGVGGCANYTNQPGGWTGAASGTNGYYLDGSGGYLLRAKNSSYSALCGKICADGYVLNAVSGYCELCPANTYMKDNECLPCPNGASSESGSLACTCPAGSNWDEENGVCDPPSCLSNSDCNSAPCDTTTHICKTGCDAGYIWDETAIDCIPCPSGTYQVDSECVACPNGSASASPTAATACLCPLNSTWDAENGVCDPPSCLSHADCVSIEPGSIPSASSVYSSCNTTTHLCVSYTPLAYLQSSASNLASNNDAQDGQCIKTGVTTTQYNQVNAKFASTSTGQRRCYIWGHDAGDVDDTFRSQFSFSKTPFIAWGGRKNYCSGTGCVTNWTVNTSDHTVTMALKTFMVDGNQVWTSSVNWIEKAVYGATLFANNAAGTIKQYASAKIYWIKFSKDGTLVAQFLPALDSSGKPGMFESVSHTMFYNEGNDKVNDFTYGSF